MSAARSCAGCSSAATRWPPSFEIEATRAASSASGCGRGIANGVPAGAAELLVAREWAILAGENDYTTETFQRIVGRPPRPLAEFVHEHRAEFT